MSKKECIVLQPKETIVEVEFSDGTVVTTNHCFWYEGEISHLKLFVNDNKQIAELQQQLAEKDETIEKLNNALVLDHSSGKWIKLCELQDKLAENAQHTEQFLKENAQLKQIIEQKDIEVQEYNNYFKSFGCKDFAEFQELIGLTKMSANDKVRDDMLRHQICEKIKEKLDNVCFDNYKDGDTPYYLNWCVKIEDVKQILDQIEKENKNEDFEEK